MLIDCLDQRVAAKHQFAHQVHERIETIDIDSNGLVGRAFLAIDGGLL